MASSPFPHHGPLQPAQVVGRGELIEDLHARVADGRPTLVTAPRGYGKTSLVGCVEARLDPTATIVRVDLYELRSRADLAYRLDAALTSVPAPRRGRLEHVAAGFELELGAAGAAPLRRAHPATDALAARLLDVLVEHARTHPTLVVLDESSSIARVEGAAELVGSLLRREADLGLVAVGSEPPTMRMLAAEIDAAAPFEVVDVPPLSLLAFTRVVDAGFDGAPPPSLASRIHSFTAGHPRRSMQLADVAWATANEGVDPTTVWSVALDRCRAATADAHEAQFSRLQPADQAVMRLAASHGAIFGRDAALLSLSRSSAQLARRRLLERGEITDVGDRLSIVDPLDADWIRRRFPL